MRRNQWGLFLTTVSLVLFGLGVAKPSVSVNELGGLRAYSLWEGAVELWDESPALSLTVIVFTLIFPVLKNVGVFMALASRSELSAAARRRWGVRIQNLGKWSFLDVWAVAILVVAVKVEGLVSIGIEPGIYYFAASIVISMLAGYCVLGPTGHDLVGMSEEKPAKKVEVGRRRKGVAAALFLMAVLFAAGGVWLWRTSEPGEVHGIVVTKNEGFSGVKLFEMGQPDYFLKLVVDGESIQLPRKDNTPIGNGLAWELESPIPLTRLSEITIHDHGMLTNKLLDRVSVSGWKEMGQDFTFSISGEISQSRWVAMTLLGLSGVVAVFGLTQVFSGPARHR